MSTLLVMKRLQSNCPAQRTSQRPSTLPELPTFSSIEEGLRCGVVYLRAPTEQLQTIEQGSKTLICISFTKLNIHLLLERVFPNFFRIFIDCYSTASKCYKETPQIPDTKRIYEETCYSHAASVVSTVTPVATTNTIVAMMANIDRSNALLIC
ncbi:hypothetical protein CSKR_104634 [Clonorchis sinensis]|uniref:Uncharacterized protein n=1 Tax=Clonorchis sinensis TaxID=79923 RepID=A0A3R7GV81_CLOSI|nr:hypothetical protein CSKR_104634 [Clonorchis sinensis]